jgi:hypothetical protein
VDGTRSPESSSRPQPAPNARCTIGSQLRSMSRRIHVR